MGPFRAATPTSLITFANAGKTLLVLNLNGTIRSIDPDLRETLGHALWTALFETGIEVVTSAEGPGVAPPEYCDAALKVIEALAPHLWPPPAQTKP
jgi:hypothetical protein